ncbi:MAG: glutamate 5-kinase [Rickettsiales bacterium]
MSLRTFFRPYRRVVVKIGSSLLTEAGTLQLRLEWLRDLCAELADVRASGTQVIVVTSGAVALGRSRMGAMHGPLRIQDKQAYAALGQTDLIHAYRGMFSRHGLHVGQILLSYGDCENRRSYLNVRNTIDTLLQYDAVPVINENDTVTTRELRFGDNDRLAAIVAQMAGADALVLLSDVDGLYTANPSANENAVHIPLVENITEEIRAMAGGSGSSVGSGGMVTKIKAAEMATPCGCDVYLTCGALRRPISLLASGEVKYTLFKHRDTLVNARKRWILGNMHVYGHIFIDAGAVKALKEGKSLLPAGVIDITGDFDRGDTVTITDCRNEEIGRGLVAYNASDARLIKGHNSAAIEHLVGFSGRTELIHRDDLVLTGRF